MGFGIGVGVFGDGEGDGCELDGVAQEPAYVLLHACSGLASCDVEGELNSLVCSDGNEYHL